MSEFSLHIEEVQSEFSLHIEEVGRNEFALSITLESVYAQNVIGAGTFIGLSLWQGTWAEYMALGDWDPQTVYMITGTSASFRIVAIAIQNTQQTIVASII